MRNINKHTVLGNVGSDPKVNEFERNGEMKKVANFSVATNERWTDANGDEQENTQWHRVVAFDKLAEIVEKTAFKGSIVYCEGPMNYREYTTPDGETRQVSELKLKEYIVLPSGASISPKGELVTTAEVETLKVEDDMPF